MKRLALLIAVVGVVALYAVGCDSSKEEEFQLFQKQNQELTQRVAELEDQLESVQITNQRLTQRITELEDLLRQAEAKDRLRPAESITPTVKTDVQPSAAEAAEIGVMGQRAASGKKWFPGNDMSAKPFTVVVFPNTQMWSQDHPDWFTASAKWVAANRAKENIKFVIQVGDIFNSYEEHYQWVNANKAMSILDGQVPYCFAVGNHDMLKGEPQWVPDASRDTTFYNDTFPYSRYENEPWYGGRMLNDVFVPSDNYDNTYHFFSVGSMEFMILSLSVAPTDDILAWANGIIAAHPNKRVIFLTHSYMSGNWRITSDQYSPPGGNAGEQVWEKFVKNHPNIFLVACGHLANGRLTTTGDSGNMVHQFVNNTNWIRILKFVPQENVIHVTSYKPWLDQYSTDNANQWGWQYDMN